MPKVLTKNSYQDYLESDRWKCNASPIDVHYWVEKDKKDGMAMFECNYCRHTTWLPLFYEADYDSSFEEVFSS